MELCFFTELNIFLY